MPARVLLLHQLAHHAEQVDLAVVEEHLGVVDVGRADDDVAEVDVVDAVALAEIAADPTGSSPISRVTPQSNVMPLNGLSTSSRYSFQCATWP